jgi:hypothetical protein
MKVQESTSCLNNATDVEGVKLGRFERTGGMESLCPEVESVGLAERIQTLACGLIYAREEVVSADSRIAVVAARLHSP